MLTPKQRLVNVLSGKPYDRVPCICPGGMMNMVIEDVMNIEGVHWPEAHVDSRQMAELTYGVYKNGLFENVGVPFCMTVEAEAMGAPVVLGTKVTEPRVSDYIIKHSSEHNLLGSIDVNQGRAKTVVDAIRHLNDMDSDVPIIANLTGPISLASSLLDPTTFYKEMRTKPEAVHGLLDCVTENLIAFGKAQLLAGADILVISDPSGTGEILGPKNFRVFVLKYLNRIIDELKPFAAGGTIIHICGRLKMIYKELNDLNSDGLSFDSITSVARTIENVSGKVIMGNVSTYTLEFGESEAVSKASENCINQGIEILSPACGVGAKTKIENIRAMVQRAKGMQGNG